MAEPGVPSAPFLPYRCDKLCSEFLRRPCEKNLARVKAMREKFPEAWIGPLEHCLTCRGLDLITREAPVSHFEGKTELQARIPGRLVAPPLPDNSQDFDKVSPLDPKEAPREEPFKEEREMAGVVVFKNEAEAERVLGPGKLTGMAGETASGPEGSQAGTPATLGRPAPLGTPAPPTAPAPTKGQFCKHHPEVESHKNKHGSYTGLCRPCMAARAAANSRNRGRKKDKGKMTPAVARDLGKKQKPGLSPVTLPEGSQAGTPAPLTAAGSSVPTCKNHPEVPAKIDSLGRSMGLCPACLTARGRASGTKNTALGLTSAPVAIPLNQAKYAEIRQWLGEQAAENERTLLQEIMYRLKLAMRAGTVWG